MSRLVLASVLLAGAPALADGDTSVTGSGETSSDDLDLRLTLSSFLYRQSGADAAPLVDQGANPQNGSPVKRFFGDLRLELTDEGLSLDARVRQTTSQRYQSGADGGGEYEIRTLDYRIGSPSTNLTVGRQFIDAVGATKIDGLAFNRRLHEKLAATVFAGLFPQLGSRSLDTDYIHVRNGDGSEGALLVPLTGGLGVTYTTSDYHGDVGVAGVYVSQDVPDAPPEQKTRVFTTSSGYWRPSAALDIYHFALLDVAGADGVRLTNGSVGVDVRPATNLQLTAALNHVSTDLLQIAARNFLTDPDPTAIGVVQNNLALLHISQDSARGTASLALAQQRFEISITGGFHRRPSVSVPLADGSGAFAFPGVTSADAMVTVLDRRSIADLRIALSGALTEPLGDAVPNRSRGEIVRALVSRMFAEQRGQIDADVMYEHVRDVGSAQSCTGSLDPLMCYGTATTSAAQGGALVSWRVAREWLLIADTHVGYQRVGSMFVSPSAMDPMTLVTSPVAWPTLWSVTAFARVQWRYR